MQTPVKTTPDTPPDYVQRVNWAIDYILANLHQPIRLEDVAQVACFSPFHFHRVFRSILKETLSDFVTRVRLERSIHILVHDPKKSLTEIAVSCGFGSSSNFSRVFKQRFGTPPSRFDPEALKKQRRDEMQKAFEESAPGHLLERLPPGENPDGFVAQIRQLPARVVAYTRVLDPYRPDAATKACESMVAWAESKGIADGQWLGYMWDDPDIVDHKDCRYDVGLEVEDIKPEGAIGRLEFPPMLVAELEIKGDIHLEMRAIDWLYATWLPNSGYLPAPLPAFESWIGRPFAHGYEHFELHVQLPVEKS